MKKLLAILPFIVIAVSTFITFSGSWVIPEINSWQARVLGDNMYFPALTVFILALPPLLLLLIIKLAIKKKETSWIK